MSNGSFSEIEHLRWRVRELEEEVTHLRVLLGILEGGMGKEHGGRNDSAGCGIYFPEITAWHAKQLYSYFKGRKDVYKRNVTAEGKGVYYPVCQHFWVEGKCPRRKGEKIRCMDCVNRVWVPLNQRALIRHLKGEHPDAKDVVGIYPLLEDDTCHFLVFDFDHHDENQPIDWKNEVDTLRHVCRLLGIDALVERSRSGNGAHVWLFFESPVPASTARKFGSCLLTRGAASVNQKTFLAYDRMLPAQDTVPEGGLGNLIALPLQGLALKSGNSAFVDEHWQPYTDQWQALAQTKRLTQEFIHQCIQDWGYDGELGITSHLTDIESPAPWKNDDFQLCATDAEGPIRIVDSGMLYICTDKLRPRLKNTLRRFSSFRNPLYYRNLAMGLSVKGLSRIICCYDESEHFIGIPRGKKAELLTLIKKNALQTSYSDNRCKGTPIQVTCSATLYPEQQYAANTMLQHETGILHATTAFGKTVLGAYLIAARKVNTLILVHNREIMKNWVEDIERFLTIDEPLPTYQTPGGRQRKRKSHLGRLYSAHNSIGGIIDIAMITSLGNDDEISPIIRNYGMVIMDECHHGAAYQAFRILNRTNARYVYGLTATPKRDDGMEQKILMAFGPIRYRYTAKQHTASLSFSHLVYPRYTKYRNADESAIIQDIYADLIQDEQRNKLIIDDVLRCIQEKRTPLILTKFRSHAEKLFSLLDGQIPHLFLLQGGRSTKERNNLRRQLLSVPPDEDVAIVAIGQYIGEGFNYPRLDTLMLATPISWAGNVEQYAGRLHRRYEGKKDVIIYDYADLRVRMLDTMYTKRLRTYKRMGYAIYQPLPLFPGSEEKLGSFYEGCEYTPALESDILRTEKELVISSPFLNRSGIHWLLALINQRAGANLNIIVYTQSGDLSKETDHTQDLIRAMQRGDVKVYPFEHHHEHFLIIDKQIVWYGNANILARHKESDNLIRVQNSEMANDILCSMEDKRDSQATRVS